ncbi:flagellar hook protein FlgE [Parvularcula sp. IMCC14364]|uniref:flagellar hook protein FlgE n=1 Tax=Parvularcula sp. IMCC14364 TaxID=3067902 RepID=UPI002740E83A|nr:flagellar hook-basal body complex protein [Parvularcula sp. IMCC14364]
MSISSSLNASVAGLRVNATRLATISDNIANSATFGYKRSDVDFSTQVLRQRENAYAAGGVSVSVFRDVEAQGSLINTGGATDLAVSGRGLLPVTDESGTTALASQRPLSLVPTGSFLPDENGLLRTSSGLFLMGWEVDAAGNVLNQTRDNASGLVPVNVSPNQFVASRTNEITLGINLPADATDAGAAGDPFTVPIEYFDNLGRSESLTITFTPDTSGTGASNQWSATIEDSANIAGGVIASFDVEFDATATATSGSILNVTNTAGAVYDSTAGTLSLNVAGGPMTLNIGAPGENGGLTQLAGPFSPNAISKDGSQIGNLTGIEIDDTGFVQAIYDSGFRRTLYQVPVADVPNLNGLQALNNQSYSVSQTSGDLYFWDSGDGPVGTVTSFALMESTTDVASELTDLIATQRAYSSNATVVQTVDEMLQETSNLGR